MRWLIPLRKAVREQRSGKTATIAPTSGTGRDAEPRHGVEVRYI
jgi:hypothetical protein